MPEKSPTESDLRGLLGAQVREGRTVDYKLAVASQDKDKKEFLADVTSFANTNGGTLYVGIREETGIPVEIVGLPSEEADSEIQRLENILMHGVDPRIPGLHIEPVACGASIVLAILIPKSWAGPHMVTFQGPSQWPVAAWGRA